MKPKKPFMIERNGKNYGALGDDFYNIVKGQWVDWNGTQFATQTEAQQVIFQHSLDALYDAKVIEIIEQVRVRSGG